MESNGVEPRQQGEGAMEVPEIDGGGDLLVELLDATLAADDGGAGCDPQQVGFAAGEVDGDDCWVDDGQELIHEHGGCEDCGLDGVLDDFDEYGSGSPRPGSPAAAPYAVFGDEDTLEWADEAMGGPFAGGCMGDWYMDGFVMAMEWEEEEDGGFSFEPVYGAEAGAEQVYGSPLWE